MESMFLSWQWRLHAKTNYLVFRSALHFIPFLFFPHDVRLQAGRGLARGLLWAQGPAGPGWPSVWLVGGRNIPTISSVCHGQPSWGCAQVILPALLVINREVNQNPVLAFCKVFWEPNTESTKEEHNINQNSLLLVTFPAMLKACWGKVKRFCFFCVI